MSRERRRASSSLAERPGDRPPREDRHVLDRPDDLELPVEHVLAEDRRAREHRHSAAALPCTSYIEPSGTERRLRPVVGAHDAHPRRHARRATAKVQNAAASSCHVPAGGSITFASASANSGCFAAPATFGFTDASFGSSVMTTPASSATPLDNAMRPLSNRTVAVCGSDADRRPRTPDIRAAASRGAGRPPA